jgi:nucleoside-diphosphate-sugar epimerase
MKILVVGSTGVLGRHTIPRLIEHGHEVKALIRNENQAHLFREQNIETAIGNILDKESLEKAIQGCEVAIHIATAIPKSGSQDWSMNDRIRREGTKNLLEVSAKYGIKKYIQQSIALLYGENEQNIVDESTPLKPANFIQSAFDMEELVRASSLNWCILRGGSFYGHGTGLEDGWRELAKEGKLLLPADGTDLISLIHVTDMAQAIICAIQNAPQQSIYNIVDDTPISYKTVYNYIANQLNVATPKTGGYQFLFSLGCDNSKAKRELKWNPFYSSFLSGLAR